MRFIVDAQLPLKLAVALNAAGHDAVHTLNLPDKNRSSDIFITRLADYPDLEAEDVYAALAYAARLTQTNHVELLAA